jgi:arsenate reductase
LGIILPETLAVMREKGISLDGQRSKGLQDVPVNEMDAFVTMGCEVECPAPAGFKGLKIEWNIPDPYGQSHHQFRNVRDLIEQQVRALLSDLEQNQLVRRENRASA